MANPQKEDGYTSIANEIMEALARTAIPSEPRRILDLIFRQTYGYQNKLFDYISQSQFAKKTKVDRRHVFRALKWLEKCNLIGSALSGDSGIRKYWIKKDWEEWKVSPYQALSPLKPKTIATTGAETIATTGVHKTKTILQNKGTQNSQVSTNPQKTKIGCEFLENIKDQKPFGWQPPAKDIEQLTGKPWEDQTKPVEIKTKKPYKPPINEPERRQELKRQSDALLATSL